MILASKSPRRSYLLKQAGLTFDVIPGNFDETTIPETIPLEYVKTLSRAKAEEIAVQYPESWVIGADTIVVIDDTILGKPKERASARAMLHQLSGKTHQVHTGFTIRHLQSDCRITHCVSTDVTFKTLTTDEIEWYVNCDEPFDKAGAYAIQGLGTFLVRRINGSYTNVVGLPVCEVIEILIQKKVLRIQDGVTDDHL